MKTQQYALLLCLFAVGVPIATAQSRYTVHDLGTLGGQYSAATGINRAGQVVGTSVLANGQTRAFRTAPNRAIDPFTDNLRTLGGSLSTAAGINSLGQVIGLSMTASGQNHAFRTAPGHFINAATDDLGTLGGPDSEARSINNYGQVAGTSSTASGDIHAFRTAANRAINPATDDLGTFGGSYSRAAGINDFGHVAGSWLPIPPPGAGAPYPRGFLWRNGRMIDVGNLGIGGVYGVNNAGQIVGGFNFRAFVWDRGVMTFLTPVSAASSTAHGINNSGQAIGVSDGIAFLYSDGDFYNLNNLIPGRSGWVLRHAAAINDRGQIAGYGDINGATHAFRLDPSPRGFLSFLVNRIRSFSLPGGIESDLSSSLRAAAEALERGHQEAARRQLDSFRHKVNAQRGNELRPAEADLLLTLASRLVQMFE